MIDYKKINEYVASMITKSESYCKLTSIAIDDLLGSKSQHITEKDLHDGIEYLIAKNKKEVEENHYASDVQKEYEKNRREIIFKSIEEDIKSYLKRQNRLK
ncbi:MAG: hypothetical protein K2K97_09920 [Muribaculaceae bacterium]|nr:hypothetical protein [Muribaculaceae bacterium]